MDRNKNNNEYDVTKGFSKANKLCDEALMK